LDNRRIVGSVLAAILCVVFLAISAALVSTYIGATGEMVTAPLSGYVGQPIMISIDEAYLGAVHVRVTGPETYRFSGEEGTATFIPHVVGQYVLSVYDMSSGEFLQSQDLEILTAPLTTDKVQYMLGDTIDIRVSSPSGTERLVIVDGEERYEYLGALAEHVRFTPTHDGVFGIDYSDGNSSPVYFITIGVLSPLGPIEQFIEPMEDVPTSRGPLDVTTNETSVTDEPARSRMNARFSHIDVQRASSRGSKHDITIKEKGGERGKDGGAKNSIEMRGVRDIDAIQDIAFLPASGTTTDIVTVHNVTLDNATVRLAKRGVVDGIARCTEYLADGNCTAWIPADILFTDLGDAVEFTVPSFSSYGGIKSNTYYYNNNRTIGNISSTTVPGVKRNELTFIDPVGSAWLIMSDAEYRVSVNSIQGRIYLYNGTAQLTNTQRRMTVALTEVQQFSYGYIHYGDGGSVIINLSASVSAAGRIDVLQSKIIAIRLDDMANAQYNSTYNNVSTANNDATYNNNVNDHMNLTITPVTTGEYLVGFGAQYNSDNVTGSAHMRLLINGTSVAEIKEADGNTAEILGGMKYMVVNLPAARTNLSLQFKSNATSTADWRYKTLFAIRLTDVFNFYNNRTVAMVNTTSTTTPLYTNNLTVSANPAREYFVVTSTIIRNNNTGQLIYPYTYMQGGRVDNRSERPGLASNFVSHKALGFINGTSTIRVNTSVLSANVGAAAAMSDSEIIVLEIGQYSGFINMTNASINASNVALGTTVKVNISIDNQTMPLDAVVLQITRPSSGPYNATLTRNGYEWYNNTIKVNESGDWVFTFYANDTSGGYNSSIARDSLGAYALTVLAVPLINNITLSPNPGQNGTSVTISANLTGPNAVSAARAQLYYPNGTWWQNVTLSPSTGNLYTGSFTVLVSPLGNYTVVVWANDTRTNTSTRNASFAPYVNMSGFGSITLDGSIADWSAPNISDTIDGLSSSSSASYYDINAGAPEVRAGGNVVYDKRLNKTIMFGGNGATGDCDGAGSSVCNGTYAYNVSNNRWYSLGAATPPLGRSNFAMAFDENINCTIIFGGSSTGGNCDGSGLNDCNGTYAYNASNNKWYSLGARNAPSARYGVGMVFDRRLNKTILFGGEGSVTCDNSGTLSCNGTYAYNASNNSWYSLGALTPPPARSNFGLAFDERLNLTILYGGGGAPALQDCSGAGFCNGTYLYNATDNKWHSITQVGPGVKYNHLLFYDNASQRIFTTGGTQGITAMTDTWVFNSTDYKWYNLTSLSQRYVKGTNGAYDPVLGAVIIPFGTNSTDSTSNQTWVFNSSREMDYNHLDLISGSVVNNASHLLVRIRLNGTFAQGGSDRYRVYFGNASATNTTTPEENSIPFSYSRYAQISGSSCSLYGETGQALGSCVYAASGINVEMGITLSALNLSSGRSINITIETASAGRRDIMPDMSSFITYTVAAQVVGFSPPYINNITSPSPFTPILGQNATILINFTATDSDGDLNGTAGQLTIRNGSVTRVARCDNTTLNATSARFNCSVQLNHYDAAGLWLVNASASDTTRLNASNSTTTVTYNTLVAISLSSVSLDFGTTTVGAQQAASGNPITVYNRGNVNISAINITGYTLVNGSSSIDVGNVTVNVTANPGKILINTTEVIIANSSIVVRNDTADLNRSLYFYITTPLGTPARLYTSLQNWVLTPYG